MRGVTNRRLPATLSQPRPWDSLRPIAGRGLARQVLTEVRWSFTPPRVWLSGVAVNLVLSLLWLAAEPLLHRPHTDWAIVVGSYFAVFILADVTTTNVLGVDAQRVRLSLLRGVPLTRILLVKNFALLVVVGLPTLMVTGLITVTHESEHRLMLTLPGVAFPILTWLGVGNLVSVILPLGVVPLRQRWEQRHQRRRTARWLTHLLLPYLLLLAVDPIGDLPRTVVSHLGRSLPRTDMTRGAVLCLVGLTFWVTGTGAALAVARQRKIHFDDYSLTSV